MRIASMFCGAALAVIAPLSGAQATTLSAVETADNDYEMYISTDDSVLGTVLAGGNDWHRTTGFNGERLTAGVTNYLHIVALNEGGPDMFVGSFSLSNSEFHFANGTQNLVTDLANWTSAAGTGPYLSPTWVAPGGIPLSFGANGDVGTTWGTRAAIDLAALFIWRSPDTQGNGDLAFFSTAIIPNPVAIPGALPLFATALAGLGLLARRKRSALAA